MRAKSRWLPPARPEHPSPPGASPRPARSRGFGGDGRGYLPVAWGVPIGAQYCTAGTKRVKVEVSYNLLNELGAAAPEEPATKPGGANRTLPPAAVYQSHFDLEVLTPGCAPANRYTDPQRIVTLFPTSQHSGGKIYIRYGDANRAQLMRPLIVAEGYDISRIAPHLQGNYGIQNFMNDIRFTNGFDLQTALENAARPAGLPNGVNGYDIVFIDYTDGADDIRRNAALFRDVVNWVNTEKATNGSTEPNVVLGISMGWWPATAWPRWSGPPPTAPIPACS